MNFQMITGFDQNIAALLPEQTQEMDTVVYVIEPIRLATDMKDRFPDGRFALVFIELEEPEWSRYLSPWSAPKVFKNGDDFAGEADVFLRKLSNEMIPGVERQLFFRGRIHKRLLAGISMAGLFAVYAMYKSNEFCGIGSVSGSLWFDHFTGYMRGHSPSQAVRRVYFSLGDREKNSRNPRMAQVQKKTQEAWEILSGQPLECSDCRLAGRTRACRDRRTNGETAAGMNGIQVKYELTSGNHFVDGRERMEKCLRFLLDLK